MRHLGRRCLERVDDHGADTRKLECRQTLETGAAPMAVALARYTGVLRRAADKLHGETISLSGRLAPSNTLREPHEPVTGPYRARDTIRMQNIGAVGAALATAAMPRVKLPRMPV